MCVVCVCVSCTCACFAPPPQPYLQTSSRIRPRQYSSVLSQLGSVASPAVADSSIQLGKREHGSGSSLPGVSAGRRLARGSTHLNLHRRRRHARREAVDHPLRRLGLHEQQTGAGCCRERPHRRRLGGVERVEEHGSPSTVNLVATDDEVDAAAWLAHAVSSLVFCAYPPRLAYRAGDAWLAPNVRLGWVGTGECDAAGHPKARQHRDRPEQRALLAKGRRSYAPARVVRHASPADSVGPDAPRHEQAEWRRVVGWREGEAEGASRQCHRV